MTERPWELRFGRHQDVLEDVKEINSLIYDSPYSERTHKGQRSGDQKNHIDYNHYTEEDAEAFVELYSPRVTSYVVAFCDHIVFRWWERLWAAAGFKTFPWVPFLKSDGGTTFQHAAPAPGVETIFIARRSRRLPVRHRPAWYGPQSSHIPGGSFIVGQKPEWIMRAVVRDWSEPGDLIVDPFAGAGTTLVAASIEGRRSIGAEVNKKTYAFARRRLEETGYTPSMFQPVRKRKPKKLDLFTNTKGNKT